MHSSTFTCAEILIWLTKIWDGKDLTPDRLVMDAQILCQEPKNYFPTAIDELDIYTPKKQTQKVAYHNSAIHNWLSYQIIPKLIL